MLAPDTRKHADPCERILSATGRAASEAAKTNGPLPSIGTRETWEVALIKASIAPFESRSLGRQAKRA